MSDLQPVFQLVQKSDFFQVQPHDFDPDVDMPNEMSAIDALCREHLGRPFAQTFWVDVNVLQPNTDLVEDYERAFNEIEYTPCPVLTPEGCVGKYQILEAVDLGITFIFCRWPGDDFLLANIGTPVEY